MEDTVLGRDIQEIIELEHGAGRGEAHALKHLRHRLTSMVEHQSKWQWCIHGDTKCYRIRVTEYLLGLEEYKKARRFALCGRGDIALSGDDGAHARVKPQGCGLRFCPRCSRRFGRPFLSRVAYALSVKAHGQLSHIVLTQRVIPRETLAESRSRFEKAWGKYYGFLRRLGLSSALGTYHVTRSRLEGWHYHLHLLVEWKPGIDGAALMQVLDDFWFKCRKEMAERRAPFFMRLVAAEGPAIDGLRNERQMEFWEEHFDPTTRTLQYIIREILQGVENWINDLDNMKQCSEFAEGLAGSKLHRLYGEWRTIKVPKEPRDTVVGAEASISEMAAAKENVAKGCILWTAIGGMDAILWGAKQGYAKALKYLSCLITGRSNTGACAMRLRNVVSELQN